MGDVFTSRLNSPISRVYSGIRTIFISSLYLVAQLVGAASPISVLFGLFFIASVVLVGVLMAIYVTFGGMLAATWVQVIKAAILLAAIAALATLCLLKGGGLSPIYTQAAATNALGVSLFSLVGLDMPLFSAVSLVAGLAFGTTGLLHLLIRAFTVRDARASQASVAIGTAIVAAVLAVLFLTISPATVAFVHGVPEFHDPAGGLRGGGNMAVVHLASAIGGDVGFGMIAAVALATILAVVAGLTVSIASAAAHDIGVCGGSCGRVTAREHCCVGGRRLGDRGQCKVSDPVPGDLLARPDRGRCDGGRARGFGLGTGVADSWPDGVRQIAGIPDPGLSLRVSDACHDAHCVPRRVGRLDADEKH